MGPAQTIFHSWFYFLSCKSETRLLCVLTSGNRISAPSEWTTWRPPTSYTKGHCLAGLQAGGPFLPSDAPTLPERKMGKQKMTTGLSGGKKISSPNSSPKLLSDALYAFDLMAISKILGISINYKLCIWQLWIALSLCHCNLIFIGASVETNYRKSLITSCES